MIQVNRIYLIFNRLVTKKFLVDTSVVYSINFVLLCSCFIINRYHMAFLQDVFKDSGVPTYTFVEPNEYIKIVVTLSTKGRCLVVEGPSGIGKILVF